MSKQQTKAERVYNPMDDTWGFPPLNKASTSDWRSTLTPDDLTTIADAARYAERWQGMTNNSPLILIDKLVKLLDKE